MMKFKVRVFDPVRRTDMSGKKLTETTFAYLNRSGRRSSAASRALIEDWISRVPAEERAHFRSRFRSAREVEFTSALHEMTLHELLRRQGCEIRFHPNLPDTTNHPDFGVREPRGHKLLLEACTSTDVSSGPEYSPRGNRIRDFLQGLELQGDQILIDEMIEGSRDLRQELIARHINDGIKAALDSSERISIQPFTTPDGWRIKVTAFPTARNKGPGGTVIGEGWSRTLTSSYDALRDSLKKKGSRYGKKFAMPYVIALNSSDAMVTNRQLQKALFGEPSGRGATARAAEDQRSTTARPTDCVWVGAQVKNPGKNACTGAPCTEIFQVFLYSS